MESEEDSFHVAQEVLLEKQRRRKKRKLASLHVKDEKPCLYVDGGLLSFPEDVLFTIFCYCDARSLLRWRCTSRYFRLVIVEEIVEDVLKRSWQSCYGEDLHWIEPYPFAWRSASLAEVPWLRIGAMNHQRDYFSIKAGVVESIKRVEYFGSTSLEQETLSSLISHDHNAVELTFFSPSGEVKGRFGGSMYFDRSRSIVQSVLNTRAARNGRLLSAHFLEAFGRHGIPLPIFLSINASPTIVAACDFGETALVLLDGGLLFSFPSREVTSRRLTETTSRRAGSGRWVSTGRTTLFCPVRKFTETEMTAAASVLDICVVGDFENLELIRVKDLQTMRILAPTLSRLVEPPIAASSALLMCCGMKESVSSMNNSLSVKNSTFSLVAASHARCEMSPTHGLALTVGTFVFFLDWRGELKACTKLEGPALEVSGGQHLAVATAMNIFFWNESVLSPLFASSVAERQGFEGSSLESNITSSWQLPLAAKVRAMALSSFALFVVLEEEASLRTLALDTDGTPLFRVALISKAFLQLQSNLSIDARASFASDSLRVTLRSGNEINSFAHDISPRTILCFCRKKAKRVSFTLRGNPMDRVIVYRCPRWRAGPIPRFVAPPCAFELRTYFDPVVEDVA